MASEHGSSGGGGGTLHFLRVSKRSPCPVCGREKSCSTSKEGVVKCMEPADKGEAPRGAPAGLKLGKKGMPCRDGGFLYVPIDGSKGWVRPNAEKVAEEEKKEEAAKAKARDVARRIWEVAGSWRHGNGGPGGGVGGENHERVREYLAFRGIDVEKLPGGRVPRALRFHPSCPTGVFDEAGKKWIAWPAMVASFVDGDGKIEGVHRTFLSREGPGKRGDGEEGADGGSAKKMKGGCSGRAIRFGRDFPGGRLLLGEGIETTLSGMVAVGAESAMGWACGSSSGMMALQLATEIFGVEGPVKWVVVLADTNKRGKRQREDGTAGVGVVSSRVLANRLLHAFPHLVVTVRQPMAVDFPELVRVDDEGFDVPLDSKASAVDWNDVLVKCGAARVRAALLGGEAFVAEVVDGEGGGDSRDVTLAEACGGAGSVDGGGAGGSGGNGGGNVGGGGGGGGGGGDELDKPWIQYRDVHELPILETAAAERARRFLWEQCRVGNQKRFRLARWGGEWWLWGGGRWIKRTDEQVRSMLWQWANGFAVMKEKDGGFQRMKFVPTGRAVGEIMEALAIDTSVECLRMPVRMAPQMREPVAGEAGGGGGGGLRPLWGESSTLDALSAYVAPDVDGGLRDLVVFKDCVIDVADIARSRKVRRMPHDVSIFTATCLPFDCPAKDLQSLLDGADADAIFARLCPKFYGWLADAGDADPAWELQAQLMVGDIASSNRTGEWIFLIVGQPGSGKGILEDVIGVVCGESNIASTSIDALGADRFALAPLVGKSAILMPDAHMDFKTGAKALEPLKVISGQGRVTVRDLYLPAQTIKMGGRIVIFCNVEPDFRDDSGALASRMIILPLRKGYRGTDKEDKSIKASIPMEAAGILLWALMGTIKLASMVDRKIPMCTDAKYVHAEYADASAHLAGFVREALELDPTKAVRCGALYEAYEFYCHGLGKEPQGRPKFFKTIKWLVPTMQTQQRRVDGEQVRECTACEIRVTYAADVAAWRNRGGPLASAGGDDLSLSFP